MCVAQPPILETTSTSAIVHLIQATCVPTQHCKLTRAKIDVERHETFLFEPNDEFSGQGIHTAEAAVSPDAENQVVLLVDNGSFNLVKLKKGMLLGKPNMVTADPTPNDEEKAQAEPGVALVTEKANADRKEQVLKAVKVNFSGLAFKQSLQLQDLLREYDDHSTRPTLEL